MISANNKLLTEKSHPSVPDSYNGSELKTQHHLHVVFGDLDLRCVNVVDQLAQGVSIHVSDLHLMGSALTHVTCTHTDTISRVSQHKRTTPACQHL